MAVAAASDSGADRAGGRPERRDWSQDADERVTAFGADRDGVPARTSLPGREVVYETVEYDGCGC